MSTLPQLVPFQVPTFSLADIYTQQARLAAWDAQRQASLLEQEEKRGRLDRESLWRQTIAGAIQPPDVVPGQGFAAVPPQGVAAGPPQAQPPPQGFATGPTQEPTMPPVGVPVPVDTRTGQWGQPGGFAGGQPGMPAAITGMAQPTDPTQPVLQGGGFTAAQPPATAQPSGIPTQQGFAAPPPQRPLSASVPGLMPLPNMAAVQQAFAIDPEKTSQWYGAYLTQRGKQLDEVKRNNQLVYQVTSAILENPTYYQEGLDYLREQGVPVPKNMPPTYDPALVKFHRDVSQERMNPLQQAQIENQKAQSRLHEAQAADVPERTRLESQRLGLQGTTATMNDELRAMGVSPLTATPEQRQQAQERIQKRELAKEGEAQRLKFEQEQVLANKQPLQDARKEDAGLFVYGGTGRTVEGTRPYGEVKQAQQDTDPDKRIVRLANLDEKKQLTTLKQLEPVLQQYSELVRYAYGPGGPMEGYSRGPFETIGAMWNQAMQKDPKLAGMRATLQGQLQSVVRGLGARGDLNEAELKAATEMIANMDASLGLGTSFGPMIGPSGVGLGMSFKPTFSIPDTAATGIEKANGLINQVNQRIGTILNHEGYARTPTIVLPQRKDGVGRYSDAPPEVVMPGADLPPAPRPARPPAPPPPLPEFLPGGDLPARPPGRQSQAPTEPAPTQLASFFGTPRVMTQADVAEAMAQTGRTREDVEQAARARGYRVVPATQVVDWWSPRRTNGALA